MKHPNAQASLSPSHDRKENFYDMTRYLPEIGCFFSTKHISIFIFWRYIWTLAALTHPPSPLGRLPERLGLEQSQDLSNNPWGGGTDEEEVKRKVEIQETTNPDPGLRSWSWSVLASIGQF